jgi:hypothetical protein
LDPLSPSAGSEQDTNGWGSFTRQQRSQSSRQVNNTRPRSQQLDGYSSTPAGSGAQTPTKTGTSNRHSMGATYNTSYSEVKRRSLFTSPPNQTTSAPTPPKLQSSYSTNDIPTVKNVNGTGSLTSPTAAPKTHAEQHFHNHNASIGRIPPGAASRQSRDLSGSEPRTEEQSGNALRSTAMQSILQANAAPFGPNVNSPLTEPSDQQASAGSATPNFGNFPNQHQLYNGYGLPMLPGMNGMSINGAQPQWQSPMSLYQQSYNVYPNYGQFNQRADSQARVIQARRNQNGEGLHSLHFATTEY